MTTAPAMLCLLMCSTAFGSETRTSSSTATVVVQAVPRPLAQDPDLVHAQEFEQQGRTDEAIALYQKIYERQGHDMAFWKLLLLLEETGRHADMAVLVRERLERYHGDPSLTRYLARAHRGMGDEEGAREVLMSIIGGNWRDAGRVAMVAGELTGWQDYDGALDIYLRAREDLGNSIIYAPEIARLRVLRMEFLDALAENLKIVDQSPVYLINCRRMIEQAREQGADPADIERVLADHVAHAPDSPGAARIYAEVLLDRGEYDLARAVVVTAAVSAGLPNEVWLLAGTLDRAGATGAAAAVYRDFASHFPDDKRHLQALSEAADHFRKAGDRDSAIDLYTVLTEEHGTTTEGRLAGLSLVELRADDLGPDGYLDALRDVARSAAFRPVARRAHVLLGSELVRRGSFDEATGFLNQAWTDSRTNGEKYEVAALQAWTGLYAGDLDAAGRHLQGCLAAGPAHAETNDLLAAVILGKRSAGDHDSDRYATYLAGRYAIFRGDPVAATDSFRIVAADTSSAAASSAARALGELSAAAGDVTGAVEWYERAAASAVDTTSTVSAFLAAADLLADDPATHGRARDFYREMLIRYPGTVHDAELRRKLTEVTDQ